MLCSIKFNYQTDGVASLQLSAEWVHFRLCVRFGEGRIRHWGKDSANLRLHLLVPDGDWRNGSAILLTVGLMYGLEKMERYTSKISNGKPLATRSSSLSSRILEDNIKVYFKKVDWGPPLWSSGQSSWLQIQISGFDSRHYQIFWVVVGLELLDRKVAAPV
jgi:hypothetical protein